MLPPHIRFGSVGTLELYADEYGILQSCESWVVGSFRVATTRKLTHYRILASLRQPGASLSPRCACRISVSVIEVTLTPLAGQSFPFPFSFSSSALRPPRAVARFRQSVLVFPA